MPSKEMDLPGVEFEGPLGRFWVMKEVPMEALVQGVVEILTEFQRRGYRQDFILELIKNAHRD